MAPMFLPPFAPIPYPARSASLRREISSLFLLSLDPYSSLISSAQSRRVVLDLPVCSPPQISSLPFFFPFPSYVTLFLALDRIVLCFFILSSFFSSEGTISLTSIVLTSARSFGLSDLGPHHLRTLLRRTCSSLSSSVDLLILLFPAHPLLFALRCSLVSLPPQELFSSFFLLLSTIFFPFPLALAIFTLWLTVGFVYPFIYAFPSLYSSTFRPPLSWNLCD